LGLNRSTWNDSNRRKGVSDTKAELARIALVLQRGGVFHVEHTERSLAPMFSLAAMFHVERWIETSEKSTALGYST